MHTIPKKNISKKLYPTVFGSTFPIEPENNSFPLYMKKEQKRRIKRVSFSLDGKRFLYIYMGIMEHKCMT